MSKRLFDYDPMTGIVEWFDYDESDDTFTIRMDQDLEQIVEANKTQFNTFSSGRDKWGEDFDRKTHVARIPMVVYQQWMIDGKLTDQAFLRKWLNDPSNAAFRTRPGVV